MSFLSKNQLNLVIITVVGTITGVVAYLIFNPTGQDWVMIFLYIVFSTLTTIVFYKAFSQ